MSEIKCPNCGEVFTVDESDYAALVRQVRDDEFRRELDEQAQRAQEAADARQEAALAQAAAQAAATAAEKDRQLADLKGQLEAAQSAAALAAADQQARAREEAEQLRAEAQRQAAERDQRIAELSVALEGRDQQAAAERELAVQQARQAEAERVAAVERERDDLARRLQAQEQQAALERDLALQRAEAQAAEARRAVERERDDLEARLERERLESERLKAAHESELAIQLRAKDDIIATREREIDDIRHMRAELSVKMLGESLEQYCENEFNKLRATGFQSAAFGKDNDAADGSKGDYIYRELDEDGNEVVSIMFEMKNEAEDSTHRRRNEDHFKKLDHDRRAKGCEYAVLVSLLERDSDYYNTGIVDVSYA
ncbi:MAG: DUF2130 domain-containing protein, partial [Eggerthellaceae bacterium]|nr:DUF2130 domain-containing protein [Eggerthellaceae bacterium]